MIPEFRPSKPHYPHRLLPTGVWRTDLAEIRVKLVQPFASSRTRPRLVDGLSNWLGEVAALGIPVVHWIDGSFVEGKLDPADVDIWSFAKVDDLESLGDAGYFAAIGLLNGERDTVAKYDCHTMMVQIFPDGHPCVIENFNSRARVLSAWGLTRPVDKATNQPYPTRYQKGFFEVITHGS